MSSFIAAGTAYATHGVNTIPFFLFYSMFGFQRIGDLIWAAADMRCRGFLIGATAGRTTLAGEGLQHQDGHSQLLAYPNPNVHAYDPAFAYELAVIVYEGIRRMYVEQEPRFYYLTVGNEVYQQPPMPPGVEEGILRGLYRFKPSAKRAKKKRVHLFGSGALMPEVLKAQEMLEKQYGVAADVWSATSYKELVHDVLEVERWNRLHPDSEPRRPYIREVLGDEAVPVVAVSDYVRPLPYSLSRWIPGEFTALGTEGFGRSEARADLRDFFEVDHRYTVLAALSALARNGDVEREVPAKALKDLGISPDKKNPLSS